ncbi:Nucleotidyltransferase/DNA polymerase DinP involved in DNA repair (DinP) (PDB:4R8U) (PUBMED:16544291) [Commensalibacter communis]|uniref:DNA-directed DNA polymerase n=1 Tax=Commensalibacter communis TaxID=2972786 RepID=A0A9W4XAP2_9PROT|nr:Y-family DNA polymerase [Commensalibacter communis]CAI3958428.1 Nucleotidyltransferase/DNA polymerase DinP involved in DNA repair (DinP) (PDB:4R8U) (PUBMED:16544291) [Commensalibacter communis]CAI3960493.1 Nucleotidyltransferase/DNA polymerase DinP involved in DNA repair (DinP) (PDB:4R8U) (PUBMED:16544291) [Commensalibacter communis]CAI3960616.1 Nucleotidyltransferase/DNA polymerase DinP involved in DNA repair (DinP) (PDB:4R8U) (PUBMED:16544291) [Commensalibacter communis]CAI3960676.1 Nucleo
MFGLVDCNNFYASCERAFNPKLEGKPIGVLSNNDGCVIAQSNELKPYVSMGMPAFKIPPDIKKQSILLSSNYELYGDMSQRVFSIVQDYIYDTEVYSIDEAFLNLEKQNNYIEYCQFLRKIVRRCTGIPVSIGISKTKTLAKIANHVAKKNPQHQGVYFLNTDDQIFIELLKQFPIEEIWGVGRKLSAKLNAMGIQTAWELRNSNASQLGKTFSVVLERTVLELQGTSCIELDSMDTPKKNIMTSRSFGKTTKELFEVQEALRVHASRGAEKLRSQNSLAQAVLVFLRTNRFNEHQPQYYPSIVIPLLYPSNDTRQIIEAVNTGLKHIFKEDYFYHKAGVMMLDLVDKDKRQLDFFSSTEKEETKARSETLMQTLDKINKKMGRHTVSFGGINKKAPWNLKREFISKRYTTRWDDLPVAKVT